MNPSDKSSPLLQPVRATSSPMDSMAKWIPLADDVTFWLAVNIVLFLCVGIFQLANGYGPGTFYSAGAIILAVIYLFSGCGARRTRRWPISGS
ncbi:MAG: hypothetical protein OK438_08865 [Thaumarchaeota archaeon]|nr:hypothetical protein [Nitrososphaerota archaeon]